MVEAKVAVAGFLMGCITSVTSVGYWSGNVEAKTEANMELLVNISKKVDTISDHLSELKMATGINATLIERLEKEHEQGGRSR